MIFRRSAKQAQEAFLNRFEPDAGGYLFRAAPTAAPVRVTEKERDEELATFLRGVQWVSWAMLAGLFAVAAVMAFAVPQFDTAPSEILIWAGAGTIIGLYVLGWWWLWRSPARRFERRAVAGPSRTRAEARRTALASLSWGQLALSFGFAAMLMARSLDGEYVWAGLGAVTAMFVTVQAVRKLIAGRSKAVQGR